MSLRPPTGSSTWVPKVDRAAVSSSPKARLSTWPAAKTATPACSCGTCCPLNPRRGRPPPVVRGSRSRLARDRGCTAGFSGRRFVATVGRLDAVVDPASYRPATGSIPESPGVYRFRDPQNRVVYVGKAKILRSRLSSYFTDIDALHPRTQGMVWAASHVDWTVVATEVEALQLEYAWIKEYDPRFNVKYRDDKSYPYLAVTLGDTYPRVQVMRGAKRRGVRYFGPYAHAWAIRETVDLLLRVFPVRTCSAGVFRRAAQIGRPCLLGYIGKCSAPCVGRVDADEHRAIVEDFCAFMGGQTDQFTRRLEARMREA